MAHADSCRAGDRGLWAVAEGVLPPSGRAHSGRAGGQGAEYSELKYIQLVTRGKKTTFNPLFQLYAFTYFFRIIFDKINK